jgi:hypothetical protein
MQIGANASPARLNAKAPVAAAATAAPKAPASPKASIEPLPKFKNPDEYKIYAIRLVSEAIVAQGDLAKAQKGLVDGTANLGDVNQAARTLNDVRAQLREMKDQVKGFKAFWWKVVHKYDAASFWKSQGLDLSTLAVRPKAIDLIATISGPPAESLKAALAAMDRNDWDGAQASFKRAAELSSTQRQALVVGQVAAGLRFDVSADNAFKRAAELALSPGEATEVASEAASFTNYKYRSAEYALRRGADLAKTKEQALAVADRASALGYVEAANYAAQKAAAL